MVLEVIFRADDETETTHRLPVVGWAAVEGDTQPQLMAPVVVIEDMAMAVVWDSTSAWLGAGEVISDRVVPAQMHSAPGASYWA